LALRSARLAPLLAFLPASHSHRSLSLIVWCDRSAGGWTRLDAEDALALNDFDGNSLPLCPLGYARRAARAVALVWARDHRRLALAQEIDHGVPIDSTIFIRSV
jgi:hypothetical protein